MWLLLRLIGLCACGLCLQAKLLWLFIGRNTYLPSKGVASVLIFLEFFVLIIKQVRHHFANKVPYSRSYGIPSSHVWMWELDHKEVEHRRTDVFRLWCQKTLESPLDSKEIKSVNPKGSQSWIFFGRTEAEAPILWPPDVKSWLTGRDPNAGKDWEQEEKRVTEDEMVGWHHWLNGHEFAQTPEMVKDREAWRAADHEITKSWTWLSNWTTTTQE